MVEIQCPRCKQARERTASEARGEALRPNYQGFCRKCALASVSEGSHRWLVSGGRPRPARIHPSGYKYVLIRDVATDELPMFRAMQRSGQPVLEHRWAMAKHLKRPLTSAEMVDHMNGVKTDNRIENLRLYVRGKNQPGSCPGHGTYFHEWQMALRRIAELEAKIKSP